ncbi:MAG: DNA mismatch repair protein MutS [Bacteroidota bacterium]
MQPSQNQVIEKYSKSIIETSQKIASLKTKIDRFSFLRVALLLIEILLFVLFVSSENETLIWVFGVLLLVPIAVFVVVVKKQSRLSKAENYFKDLLWVYQNEVNVITLQENGYDNGTSFEDENHPYLSDLDIFGKSSLYALINRCSTKIGVNFLAAQLALPNVKIKIDQRQKAVQELTENIDGTFEFRAILKGNDVNGIDQLKQKLKDKLSKQLEFMNKPVLKVYIKILPFVMPIFITAGIIAGGKLWGILILILLIHAGLTFFLMKHINEVYYDFGGSATLLADYADAIKWTEERNWKSEYIKNLFTSDKKVSSEIKKLSKIIQAFDARLNLLVGGLLNFTLLWDLRCCAKLAEWHQTSSSNVADGLERISYFEELISVATLSYNNPNWVFPIITNDFCLVSQDVGHPLIPRQKCVANDFSIDAKPTVDIVTGSNMAGKSTFLRTLGINMIMAYAGVPVCAKSMKISIFNILTYMRIKDSLNESTSTFKAELNRLKMILEKVQINNHPLVLIDEMLRGTNSKDKFLGSKVFIEKLITVKTPTLFATHDLQLSELQTMHPEAVRNYHFDIQINNGEMEFDYKIKNGPCDKFNAAILLKQIGLSIDN